MVERFNHTLAQELTKYCAESQYDWDAKLPVMLMAYRSAEHEATAYTPARRVFGRELRLPVDLATGRPPDKSVLLVRTSFMVALQARLSVIHHQLRGSLKLADQAMKCCYYQ